MKNYFQQTLKKTVSCSGIGLHSGKKITVTLKPWIVGGGVVFKRSDLNKTPLIYALAENVVDTKLATTIANREAKISTIEHLMAVIRICEIDNILIEVDGPELPIFDGSASIWLEKLNEAGLISLMAPKKFYRLTRPFKYTVDDKWISVKPSLNFKIKNTILFANPIGKQSISLNINKENFSKELSVARTFCLLQEIEYLRSVGLAKGGSLDNAIVVDDEGVLNKNGLRFENEFARHKALDFIGDISLIDANIIGDFSAYKSGHDLNNKFLKALINTKGLLEPIFVPNLGTQQTGFSQRRQTRLSNSWGFPPIETGANLALLQ